MRGGLIEHTLQAQLVQTFEDPAYRPPPLPSVAMQIFRLTRSDEVRVDYVVSLLEQDTMLAGAVFRLVSSPMYAGRWPTASLQQAVIRLGMKTLRSIVFEASLRQGIFNMPEYGDTVERLRRHSTTSAYLAKIVCERCGIDQEIGFLCGLLHDVGFSALLFAVSNMSKEESPKLSALWHDFDGMHERATMVVARLWELPPEICASIGRHHHHELCASDDERMIAAAVCIADSLSERFGASVVGPLDSEGTVVAADTVLPESLESARRILRIDDQKFAAIVKRADEIIPEILWV